MTDDGQPRPNSWYDTEGREWCYGCKQQVLWFKEGWICSADCPYYKGPDEPEATDAPA